MQLFNKLQIALACATLANAQELPQNKFDLSLAQLPPITSYQEILNNRYQSLGFNQVEIDQILKTKAEIREGQPTWPAYTDFSDKVKIIIGINGAFDGRNLSNALGLYDRDNDSIHLSEKIAALGSTAMLLILRHELQHSCQVYPDNIRDFAFTPNEETSTKLALAEEKLNEINLKLKDLNFDISGILFEDLYTITGDIEKNINEKQQVYLSLLSPSISEMPNEDTFNSDQIEKAALKIASPEKSNDTPKVLATAKQEPQETQDLLLEIENSKKIIPLIKEYRAIFREYVVSMHQNFYYLAKNEIDPRLSNINYYWMEHQKEQGLKPEAVLNTEQAQKAYTWFMTQRFPFGTEQFNVQCYIRKLLLQFEEPERENIIKTLLERACGLANITPNNEDINGASTLAKA